MVEYDELTCNVNRVWFVMIVCCWYIHLAYISFMHFGHVYLLVLYLYLYVQLIHRIQWYGVLPSTIVACCCCHHRISVKHNLINQIND
jgi:hypothetical protein